MYQITILLCNKFTSIPSVFLLRFQKSTKIKQNNINYFNYETILCEKLHFLILTILIFGVKLVQLIFKQFLIYFFLIL